MTPDTTPLKKQEGTSNNTWTTGFELNPDAFIDIQLILDILRSKNDPKIDPKIAQEEAEDLFGK